MLTYIEAHKGKKKWISGIFLNRQDAVKYFNSIPSKLKIYQELKEAPFYEYPIYILESFEFTFTGINCVHEAIKAIVPIFDNNAIYMNIFRISEDYTPPEHGTDYMGNLSHDHVSNDFLEHYRKTGGGFASW